MNDKSSDQENFRAFQLMSEIEAGEAISQRELAGRMGIAVGLVNSYLKNFVAKGYVRVKIFPRKRYAYLLTPKGIAEKGRLAFQHINYFTSLYTTTRQEYLSLFCRLKVSGAAEVVFCGVDEVAEIAYLSLQEAGLKLTAVYDQDSGRTVLFEHPVQPLSALVSTAKQPIIVTSLKRQESLVKKLAEMGIPTDAVWLVGKPSGS